MSPIVFRPAERSLIIDDVEYPTDCDQNESEYCIPNVESFFLRPEANRAIKFERSNIVTQMIWKEPKTSFLFQMYEGSILRHQELYSTC